MGEQQIREVVEEMFALTQKGDVDGLAAHLDDDIVVEFPQSGEKIEGSKNVLEVYRNYPEGSPSFALRRVRVAGNLAIAEHDGEYPDGSTWHVASIFEFIDGRVVRETDYFSQGFDPPEWRAQWVTKS